MTDVTIMLARIESGDEEAGCDLLPLVYEELRRLAAKEIANEQGQITLQPTALVHEAYLRLVDQRVEQKWSHRGHFYAAAAQAMRRILVEAARRRLAKKRGGDLRRTALDAERIPDTTVHPDIIALDEALSELSDHKPEIARLVSLRYFGGLTIDQAAQALNLSRRTATRNWTYAKAWLLEYLRGRSTDSRKTE